MIWRCELRMTEIRCHVKNLASLAFPEPNCPSAVSDSKSGQPLIASQGGLR